MIFIIIGFVVVVVVVVCFILFGIFYFFPLESFGGGTIKFTVRVPAEQMQEQIEHKVAPKNIKYYSICEEISRDDPTLRKIEVWTRKKIWTISPSFHRAPITIFSPNLTFMLGKSEAIIDVNIGSGYCRCCYITPLDDEIIGLIDEIEHRFRQKNRTSDNSILRQ
ncbi:MAG: hypothetical protein LBJ00_11155 [Planctomycetaceae bacterium]|nr:hypothetical protein [Planctomycetaceae bacterium]